MTARGIRKRRPVNQAIGESRALCRHVGDELVVTAGSRSLTAPEALLARGNDPATPYNMRHASSDVLSFVTTTIGHAAGLSVSDALRPRFQKFVPFKGLIEEAAE
jgi:hypothetical protein